MKKFYEVHIAVEGDEVVYRRDYEIYVKANCIKDAIDGAIMHLYDTEDIYDKEILTIGALKMDYIEVEGED